MKPYLAFFLSRNTPLARWDKLGLFQRETLLYRHLRQQENLEIMLVSSGDTAELQYETALAGIHILPNRWRFPPNLYSLIAPFLHRHALRQATIYKTNQLDGAWTAILAGKLYGKPVIVRAGYLWGKHFSSEHGTGLKTSLIYRLQTFVLRQATQVVVTTAVMKNDLIAQYQLPPSKISIIPNYVDTTHFAPQPEIEQVHGRVCFIGRLNSIKNLDLLIEALASLPQAHLVLIGSGAEQAPLEALAHRLNVSVTFRGQLAHDELPAELNRAAIFVLPSQLEGHPKALIEAMACGTAVLGTDVEGIREVIQHGQTGWLCPPTVEGLSTALQTLLADPALRQQLGQNARHFALQTYSLDQIVQAELALYQQLT